MLICCRVGAYLGAISHLIVEIRTESLREEMSTQPFDNALVRARMQVET